MLLGGRNLKDRRVALSWWIRESRVNFADPSHLENQVINERGHNGRRLRILRISNASQSAEGLDKRREFVSFYGMRATVDFHRKKTVEPCEAIRRDRRRFEAPTKFLRALSQGQNRAKLCRPLFRCSP